MASQALFFLLLLSSSFAILKMASARDTEIVTDFILPVNVTSTVDGNFFTFTGMRSLVDTPQPTTFKVTKSTMGEFPALNGQGVSVAFLQFPSGTVNGPHIHPRAAELLFLIQGSLEVGFVDTTTKLYKQTLKAGDIFVFPKGLLHYQYNPDGAKPAIALASFGSANPGTISLPLSLFNTAIDETILAKAFKTDVGITKAMKNNFAPKL